MFCEPFSHVFQQFWRLDEDDTIIDGIPFEDIAERAAYDERYTRMFDRCGSLFAG